MDTEYRLEDLAYVDTPVNEDIQIDPDSYLYLHDLVMEAVNTGKISLLTKVINKVPNIVSVLDFPELLVSSNNEQMIKSLYTRYLEAKNEYSLELLEDKIRDLQEDNPDMYIIKYHQEHKTLWH